DGYSLCLELGSVLDGVDPGLAVVGHLQGEAHAFITESRRTPAKNQVLAGGAGNVTRVEVYCRHIALELKDVLRPHRIGVEIAGTKLGDALRVLRDDRVVDLVDERQGGLVP